MKFTKSRPVHYTIVPRSTGWAVIEYSRYGEAVRGEYPTKAEAEARINQLRAGSRKLEITPRP